MGSSERAEREKAERRRQRKSLIIAAAEKLFLEKGFSAARIGEIAAACELTNGAIYLYFKNKDELILMVMTGISNSFGDLLEQSASEGSGLSGAERLEMLLNVYNQTYAEYRAYHRLDAEFNLIFADSYPDSPLLSGYYDANRRVLDVVTAAVRAGIDDGSISSGVPAERTSRLLLNAVNSYVEKISLRKDIMEAEQGISMEDELAEYLQFLTAALRSGG